ncbi:MAG: type II toxin-antitoxin system RelE/ParE family toxin [Thaumarchaeota archaeon]|nr:type II toxin-antitoxin system RelE/ParE family toxin [Nitrososphaerota archaeon]
MKYSVVFLNVFLKQFKKIPSDMQERIKQRILQLVENPYLGLGLRGNLEGFWKDRLGEYRIIYKIEKDTIVFYDIDLRKRIYDR